MMQIIGFSPGSLKKYILLFFLLIASFSCKDDPVKPPPDEVDFSISVEDVSCIEAWVNLKVKSASEIKLFRNDSLIKTINTFPLDTIIYDEGLLPNQSYTYKAEVLFNNQTYTKEASALTMDTTSHNFTWQSWEFGQHSSSQLFDVAIIDENNIWAVGEIYIYDSLGQVDPLIYNAVHWDGEKWELKRIQVNFRGNIITLPLEGVFIFSSSDIWFVGSLPIHGDGINWNIHDLRATVDPTLSLSKVWGTSSNNIYFIGRSGSIAHYNGTSWKRIESGTEENINDIYGSYNLRTKEYEILAVASNINHSIRNDILKISTSGTELMDNYGVEWTLSSVWFKSERKYYMTGTGIFEKNNLSNTEWKGEPVNINTKFINRIRGSDYNNIYTAGAFGELIYFNGIKWNDLTEETGNFNGTYFSLDVKDKIISAAGTKDNKAIVFIGKHD